MHVLCAVTLQLILPCSSLLDASLIVVRPPSSEMAYSMFMSARLYHAAMYNDDLRAGRAPPQATLDLSRPVGALFAASAQRAVAQYVARLVDLCYAPYDQEWIVEQQMVAELLEQVSQEQLLGEVTLDLSSPHNAQLLNCHFVVLFMMTVGSEPCLDADMEIVAEGHAHPEGIRRWHNATYMHTWSHLRSMSRFSPSLMTCAVVFARRR